MSALEQTFSITRLDDLFSNQEVEQNSQEIQDEAMSSRTDSQPSSDSWYSFMGLLAFIATPYIR